MKRRLLGIAGTAPDLIATLQKQPGKIASVLPGNTANENSIIQFIFRKTMKDISMTAPRTTHDQSFVTPQVNVEQTTAHPRGRSALKSGGP
jgi:hypothetical protein